MIARMLEHEGWPQSVKERLSYFERDVLLEGRARELDKVVGFINRLRGTQSPVDMGQLPKTRRFIQQADIYLLSPEEIAELSFASGRFARYMDRGVEAAGRSFKRLSPPQLADYTRTPGVAISKVLLNTYGYITEVIAESPGLNRIVRGALEDVVKKKTIAPTLRCDLRSLRQSAA